MVNVMGVPGCKISTRLQEILDDSSRNCRGQTYRWGLRLGLDIALLRQWSAEARWSRSMEQAVDGHKFETDLLPPAATSCQVWEHLNPWELLLPWRRPGIQGNFRGKGRSGAATVRWCKKWPKRQQRKSSPRSLAATGWRFWYFDDF